MKKKIFIYRKQKTIKINDHNVAVAVAALAAVRRSPWRELWVTHITASEWLDS
jgi:1,2-phenylacetyl-CoA epoxidase PaaB subunit